jgi:hypothetical protein
MNLGIQNFQWAKRENGVLFDLKITAPIVLEYKQMQKSLLLRPGALFVNGPRAAKPRIDVRRRRPSRRGCRPSRSRAPLSITRRSNRCHTRHISHSRSLVKRIEEATKHTKKHLNKIEFSTNLLWFIHFSAWIKISCNSGWAIFG